MPKVAEIVLNKCITTEGDPTDEDFKVIYDFKYIDIHPDEHKGVRKVWYVNVSSYLLHTLYQFSIGNLFINCT